MFVGLVAIGILAWGTTNDAHARSHRHAPKPAAASAVAKPANIPEKDRDPADIALDRKIKGICRGC
jgi:hypothetical protein